MGPKKVILAFYLNYSVDQLRLCRADQNHQIIHNLTNDSSYRLIVDFSVQVGEI